jgi:DNA modification methylase
LIDNIAADLLPLAVDIKLLDFLTPNPNIGDVPAVMASYEQFGQLKPIVVQRRKRSKRGTVEAGNTQLQAALNLGWTKLAVVWVTHDDLTAAAFALADNRTADLGREDEDALLNMLLRLSDSPELMTATGYDDDYLARLIAAQNPEPEREPPPIMLPENPVTRRGDVWQLGDHRIMCGDCRDAGDVATLLAGAKIDLAVTSPPYADRRKYDEETEFEPIPPDKYVAWFSGVAEQVAKHLVDDGSWIVNIKPGAEGLDTYLYVHDLVAAHVRQWGWHFATEFCWERSGVPKGPVLRLKNQFEPVYQFVRSRWKFYPDHVRHLTDSAITPVGPGGGNTSWDGNQGSAAVLRPEQTAAVGEGWAFPGNRIPPMKATHEATGHPAAFPVGLPEFFVRLMTLPGDNVYDPFVGSGSTIMAAENQERSGFGMELSPVYVDVAVARWQAHTGRVPNRVGIGDHDFRRNGV